MAKGYLRVGRIILILIFFFQVGVPQTSSKKGNFGGCDVVFVVSKIFVRESKFLSAVIG